MSRDLPIQQTVVAESRGDDSAGEAAQSSEAGLRARRYGGVQEDEIRGEPRERLDQRHGHEVGGTGGRADQRASPGLREVVGTPGRSQIDEALLLRGRSPGCPF